MTAARGTRAAAEALWAALPDIDGRADEQGTVHQCPDVARAAWVAEVEALLIGHGLTAPAEPRPAEHG